MGTILLPLTLPRKRENLVGIRIRELRDALRLSQTEFAAAIGVKRGSTVSNWELNRGSPPRLGNLRLAADLAPERKDETYAWLRTGANKPAWLVNRPAGGQTPIGAAPGSGGAGDALVALLGRHSSAEVQWTDSKVVEVIDHARRIIGSDFQSQEIFQTRAGRRMLRQIWMMGARIMLENSYDPRCMLDAISMLDAAEAETDRERINGPRRSRDDGITDTGAGGTAKK